MNFLTGSKVIMKSPHTIVKYGKSKSVLDSFYTTTFYIHDTQSCQMRVFWGWILKSPTTRFVGSFMFFCCGCSNKTNPPDIIFIQCRQLQFLPCPGATKVKVPIFMIWTPLASQNSDRVLCAWGWGGVPYGTQASTKVCKSASFHQRSQLADCCPPNCRRAGK